jgi:hypothetical protein
MNDREEMQARAETAAAVRGNAKLEDVLARVERTEGHGLTPNEVLTLAKAAGQFHALRKAFPESEDDEGVTLLDTFVLHTVEWDADGHESSCTYQATTRAEFDEQIQELMDRATYRQKPASGLQSS